MAWRTRSTEPAAERLGIFPRIGAVVVRWPWLVIAFWLALAGILPALFPTLTEMVQRKPVPILPTNAPVTVTTDAMSKAFQENSSANILLVVLTNEKGLTKADEGTYKKIVDTLRDDPKNVIMLQDFLSVPPLREIMTSKDNKAWMLPVGVFGELGSPESYIASTEIAKRVKAANEGSDLTVNLTGPAATLIDMVNVGEKDQLHIEIATIVMLLVILLMIYRNPITLVLPLISIGVSLTVAQGVIAGMAVVGLTISNQTIIFLNAMMAGTGVDYAVFLISRYHDYLRMGDDTGSAIKKAMGSVGKVIAASAATVAVTFLGMIFTRLSIFSTVGIALAVGVAIACLSAVTFLPALMVLAGRRGWIKPRRDLTSRFWRRSGIRIVRRPGIHLAVSLVILAALASCSLLVKYNYDDRKALPQNVDSSVGYQALDRHFPLNQTIPQYIFIHSPNDLRTPQALADLEQMAQRVSQIPGVAIVRGITRPTGESLEQARLSYQAGEVGTRLQDASTQINDRSADLDRLKSGANQLADSLGAIRGQVAQAIATVRGLVDALGYMQNQYGANKTFQDIKNAAALVDNMRALGSAIGTNLANVLDLTANIDAVLTALDASPICDADPRCSQSRDQLHQLVEARDNGTFDRVADLGRLLQSTQSTQTLDATSRALNAQLDAATKALSASGLGTPKQIQARLNELQQGADLLATASRQIADGVQLLVDSTMQIGSGLTEASSFLLAMKTDAAKEPMAGFYIPPQFLAADEFKKAAAAFISSDGHSVRYLVQNDINPFSTEAMDLVNKIIETAQAAQPNTKLEGASISMAGFSVMLRDVRDYYNHDIRLIIVMTIFVVLGILMALLRAIVAPLYLIGSVIISYLSALGIGVVVFQLLLGQELHWSVPGLTFIVLVAVGADYNLLLISRIRDESPHGIRSGIIKTVGSTGGVITAAGLIFAASMFGLLFASISTLLQAGFVVGVGILLDTFLVRTVTVPSIATLIGKANWWPAKVKPEPHKRRNAPAPQEANLSEVPSGSSEPPAPMGDTPASDPPAN